MGDLADILLLSTMAGLGTSLGALVVFVKQPGKWFLGFFMGLAAGIMIMLSFLGLMSEAQRIAGLSTCALGFVTGSMLMLSLDFLLPHIYFKRETGEIDSRFTRASILISVGISLHNFPEGVAVASGYSSTPSLGSAIALAIALHNIPEGMAVSLPMCASGARRSKACGLAILSGLVEPLGALVAGLFLQSFRALVPLCLSFAGGVMVFVTIDELIPVAREHGHEHFTSFGVIVGCILAFALLGILS